MDQNFTAELNEQIQSVMESEDWLRAIELGQNHIDLVKINWELSWNLGWSYFKLDRFEEAHAHLLRATNLAPGNSACHWALGQAYQRLEKYKEAEASLNKSLSIRDSHIARIALALTYLKQGKLTEAEQTHLEGLRLKPNDSERYKSYGAFLSDVGRREEALEIYRRSRALRVRQKGAP